MPSYLVWVSASWPGLRPILERHDYLLTVPKLPRDVCESLGVQGTRTPRCAATVSSPCARPRWPRGTSALARGPREGARSPEKMQGESTKVGPEHRSDGTSIDS